MKMTILYNPNLLMRTLHAQLLRIQHRSLFTIPVLAFLSIGVAHVNAQTQPPNTLSILSYGASTGSSDNTTAIQNCINAAQTAGEGVWIPAGTYKIQNSINATGILIAGAGMTSSIIYRQQTNSSSTTATQLSILGGTVQDIGLDGNGTSRGVNASYGINIKGVGWLIQRVMIHHSDAGIWASGTSGTVEDCILTNTFADGVNINNAGTTASVAGANLTVENCTQTGAGDDGFAINSQGDGSGWANMVSPQILSCTSLNDDGANGIGVYGGSNPSVESCLVSNTIQECGILVSSYGSGGFGITNGLIENNVIYGSGTVDASACVETGDARTTATFIGNILNNSAGAGFQVGTPTYPNAGNIVFGPNNVINHPAGSGIAIQSGVVGAGIFVTNTVLNLNKGQSYFVDGSSTFTATVIGNNWQRTIIPATPVGLLTTVASGQVGLSWLASSGITVASSATSYNIKRSTIDGGPYTTIATGVSTLNYNDSGLNNGTTYFYVISAVNAAGESDDSTQISAIPQVIISKITFSSGMFTNNSVLGLVGSPAQELYGVSLGNGVAQTTDNGYVFNSYPDDVISYGGSSGSAYSGFLGGGGTSGDAAFDAVLNDAWLGINSGTLMLSNLIVGTTCEALFLEADTRNGMGTRTFAITSEEASSPAQSYAFAGGSPYLGGYILCTFTVTTSTQTFTNTQAAYGYQLDGLLLSTIYPFSTNSPPLYSEIGDGMIRFSWPSDHIGWRLETQTNSPGLGLGANWFTVPGSSASDEISVPINSTEGSVFFRLVYP
jgi:hypothetical protein